MNHNTGKVNQKSASAARAIVYTVIVMLVPVFMQARLVPGKSAEI